MTAVSILSYKTNYVHTQDKAADEMGDNFDLQVLQNCIIACHLTLHVHLYDEVSDPEAASNNGRLDMLFNVLDRLPFTLVSLTLLLRFGTWHRIAIDDLGSLCNWERINTTMERQIAIETIDIILVSVATERPLHWSDLAASRVRSALQKFRFSHSE